MDTLDTLNATANRELIAAIRVAYGVASLLPLLDAAEHVRFIARAWREASRVDVFAGLWALGEALAHVEGAYDAHRELTRATSAAATVVR